MQNRKLNYYPLVHRVILLFIFISIGFTSQAQFVNDYLLQNPGKNFYEVAEAVEAHYADKDKGRGSGYKQFKQWEMMMEPYFYPSGEMFNINAKIYQEYKKYQRSHRDTERAPHGSWTDEGPYSYSPGYGWTGGNGRVNCIVVHPTNPSTIYAGTPAGGLWVSYNSGSTWTALTDGMPTLGVSGFAINYDNTNIMYLLTGDGDGNNSPSIGVLKSTDGGQSWMETGLSWGISWDFPNLIRAYKLVMHPTNPNILFVATNNGIWRTQDGGNIWIHVSAWHTWDIEFQPGNPYNLYAAGADFFRSTNGGISWVVDSDVDFPSDYRRIAIAVTPADTSYVYLLFGGHVAGTGNGTFSGLYRSTNGGADFSLRSTTPNILGYPSNGLDSANQASYDLAITADPLNAEVIYTGGINVWKSVNGGSAWTITSYWYKTNNSIGYTHADIHALEIQGSTLYCGSDGGIFKSTDGANTWANLSGGMSIMQFNFIDVENTVYAGGAWDNGCNQWTQSTSNATHTIGADGFACLIDYNNTNIRYQSDQENRYRSNDGGTSFYPINIPAKKSYWQSDWIMDPVDPDRLYMAGLNTSDNQDIYRTTTGGLGIPGWTDLNAGFTGTGVINSMAQGTNNRDVLYASNGTEIRRCDNVNAGLPAWVNIAAGLPVPLTKIKGITVDPANASRVWVCFSGMSAGNKVFSSINGGATWVNESGSLPNVPVNCIAYHPGSADGIYIGTDIGVFYRNDGIGDWDYYTNGMPTVRVFDLDIEGGSVYAATHGRGLWKSDLYTTCVASLNLTPLNDPSNANFTGVQRYHAFIDITSSRIITGGIGTDVIYNAASAITFTEGFHARKGNLFEAKLQGCPE